MPKVTRKSTRIPAREAHRKERKETKQQEKIVHGVRKSLRKAVPNRRYLPTAATTQATRKRKIADAEEFEKVASLLQLDPSQISKDGQVCGSASDMFLPAAYSGDFGEFISNHITEPKQLERSWYTFRWVADSHLKMKGELLDAIKHNPKLILRYYKLIFQLPSLPAATDLEQFTTRMWLLENKNKFKKEASSATNSDMRPIDLPNDVALIVDRQTPEAVDRPAQISRFRDTCRIFVMDIIKGVGRKILPLLFSTFVDEKKEIFSDDSCYRFICGYERSNVQMSAAGVDPLPVVIRNFLVSIEEYMASPLWKNGSTISPITVKRVEPGFRMTKEVKGKPSLVTVPRSEVRHPKRTTKKAKRQKKGGSRSEAIASKGLEPQIFGKGPIEIVRDDQLPSSLMLLAVSLVWPIVAAELNNGPPIDYLLASGREGRKLYGLPDIWDGTEKMTVKAVPMLTEEMRESIDKSKDGTYVIVAPMVLLFDNIVSADFRNRWLDNVDDLMFSIDGSCQGDSSIRASIKRPADVVTGKPPKIGERGQTPIMIKGKSAAVPSVPQTDEEQNIGAMLEELTALFVDRTNALVCELISKATKSDTEGICEITGDIPKDEIENILACWDITQEDAKSGPKADNELSEDDQSIPFCPPEETPAAPAPKRQSAAAVRRGGSRRKRKPIDGAASAAKGDMLSMIMESLFGTIAPRDKSFWSLIPRVVVRLLLIKCGVEAAYGFHRDSSWILNSRNLLNPTLYNDGTRLPTIREMCVVTLALGRDESNTLTAVEHSNHGLTGNNKSSVVSKVFTGRCSAHLQSYMAQLYKHRSYSTDHTEPNMDGTMSPPTGVPRCVVTARGPLDPIYESAAYEMGCFDDGLHPARDGSKKINNIYNAKGVMTDSRTICKGKDEIKVSIESYRNETVAKDLEEFGTMSNPNCIPVSAKFSRLSYEMQEKYHYQRIPMHPQPSGIQDTGETEMIDGIQKPVKIYSLKQVSMHDIVTRQDCVERFLNCEIPTIPKLCSMAGDMKDFSQPLFIPASWKTHPRPVNPLEVIHIDELAGTGVNVSKRSSGTINPNNPCLFLSSQAYKEGWKEMFRWINFFERVMAWHHSLVWDTNEDYMKLQKSSAYIKQYEAFEKEYELLPDIPIRGHGGANQHSGQTGFSNTSKKADPHIDVVGGQDFNNLKNQALINLGLSRRPFLFLYNKKNFDSLRYVHSETTEGTGGCESSESDVSTRGDSDSECTDSGDDSEEEKAVPNPDIDTKASAKAGKDERTNARTELCSLFYMYVTETHKIGEGTWPESRKVEYFKELPGYLAQNVGNCSYLNSGYFECMCRGAFAFRTVVRVIKNEQQGVSYMVAPISDPDWDLEPNNKSLKFQSVPLKKHKWSHLSEEERAAFVSQKKARAIAHQKKKRAALRKAAKAAAKKATTTAVPPSIAIAVELEELEKKIIGDFECIDDKQVNRGDFVSYWTAKDDKEFLDSFAMVPEDVIKGQDPDVPFAVTAKQLIAACIDQMMSAAYRIRKELSVILKDGVEVPVPLSNQGSQRLHSSSRLKASPTPNPDFDKACVFLYESFVLLMARHNNFEESPTLHEVQHFARGVFNNDFQHACGPIDLTVDANKALFSDMLLMTVAFRFTGNTDILALFPEWRDEYMCPDGFEVQRDEHCPCLPTTETLPEFMAFLKACCSGSESFSKLVSKQHDNAIPQLFHAGGQGPARFCRFLELFSTTGASLVISDLNKMSGRPIRKHIRDSLEEAIRSCSGAEVCSKMHFATHKVIADLEMIFHGFAGEVTSESLGFGAGGKVGKDILTRSGEYKGKLVTKQFEMLHDEIKTALNEQSDDTLAVLGWRKLDKTNPATNMVEKVLVSTMTGVEFSLTHTEHMCCKVYIYCSSVHSSRTGSKQAVCFTSFCWPVPGEHKWYHRATKAFSLVEDAFERLDAQHRKDNEGVGYLEANMPHSLQYGDVYLNGIEYSGVPDIN